MVGGGVVALFKDLSDFFLRTWHLWFCEQFVSSGVLHPQMIAHDGSADSAKHKVEPFFPTDKFAVE